MRRRHHVWAIGLAAMALCLLAATAPLEAQTNRKDWVRLGVASPDAERGTLDLQVAAASGAWAATRIEVKGGDLTVTSITIQYAGGARFTEARVIALLEGERTRPLDLGPARRIEKVEIAYRRETPSARVATVEVWALRGGDAPSQPTVAAVAPSSARPANQELLLGTARVAYRDTAGGFDVGESGRFARLRLRAFENEVFIAGARVFYANGESETVDVNARVSADEASPWIPVKSDAFIRRVEFAYRSRPSFRGQARVELVGELADGWLGPRGLGRYYNGGWVLLGAQTAGFVGFDRDLVPVGRNEGGFQSLRVTVRDRAITLDELRIVYETGGVQVIRIERRIRAGQTFGPVAVDPSRPIREIRARYRSRYFDRKATSWRPAIVELWGEH